MRQVEGTVPVLLEVAVPQRDAWGGSIFLLFLLFLAIGSSTFLAAETSPLDHAKATARVAPPPKISSKSLDPVRQKGSNLADCAPSAEPAKHREATTISPASPDAPANNNDDASSPTASDLTVRLPSHEELEKDEIRLPADAQAGAVDGNQDKEKFHVGLKDKDKESEPANGAPGSPAQCSLPSTTQSVTGSPTPH